MHSISVVFVFKDTHYLILRSCQIIVLVSMLLEFAVQSRFLCRVSDDFVSRLLSIDPLLKSFHNVAIFGQCFETTTEKTKKHTKKRKKVTDSMKMTTCMERQLHADNCYHFNLTKH